MEQATLLDLIQLIGILLKVFALVVLAVTLAITIGVVAYMLMQSLWVKALGNFVPLTGRRGPEQAFPPV